jgi:hypothetical protein
MKGQRPRERERMKRENGEKDITGKMNEEETSRK